MPGLVEGSHHCGPATVVVGHGGTLDMPQIGPEPAAVEDAEGSEMSVIASPWTVMLGLNFAAAAAVEL